MDKKVFIVIIALVILGVFIVSTFWRKDILIPDSQEEIERLKEQIRERDTLSLKLTQRLDSLQKTNLILQAQNDSLDLLKQKVIIKYHEIYIGLNAASNKQLDSIIRTNW